MAPNRFILTGHPTNEEARQSFRDEAARAWQAYERDGQHVAQAEVDAWVDSLRPRERKRRSREKTNSQTWKTRRHLHRCMRYVEHV